MESHYSNDNSWGKRTKTKKGLDTKADAADNRMLSDEEIKQARDNSITTPYDVLGSCD